MTPRTGRPPSDNPKKMNIELGCQMMNLRYLIIAVKS